MTDRKGSPKGFLKRWSRKKIDAEREAPEPTEADAKGVSPADQARNPERQTEYDAKIPATAAQKPEFDLASLPSLNSITASTDIRAFLAPGVPIELTRAALRRAWAADPAIRDFKGLAENDWDFTDPTAIPGFGALPAGTDIKKMLAQIFGEGEKRVDPNGAAQQPGVSEEPLIADESTAPDVAAEAAPPAGHRAESNPSDISAGDQQIAQSDIVHRVAMHNKIPNNDSEIHTNRRQRGGALPE